MNSRRRRSLLVKIEGDPLSTHHAQEEEEEVVVVCIYEI